MKSLIWKTTCFNASLKATCAASCMQQHLEATGDSRHSFECFDAILGVSLSEEWFVPFFVLILSCSSVFCHRRLKQEGPQEKAFLCAWISQCPRTVANKSVLSYPSLDWHKGRWSNSCNTLRVSPSSNLRRKMLCALACLFSFLIFSIFYFVSQSSLLFSLSMCHATVSFWKVPMGLPSF